MVFRKRLERPSQRWLRAIQKLPFLLENFRIQKEHRKGSDHRERQLPPDNAPSCGTVSHCDFRSTTWFGGGRTSRSPALHTPNVNDAVFQTNSGSVRGTVANDVIAFKGIPFAAPPVGELRWRAPQPVQRWPGVREATAYSADPMQPQAGGSLPVRITASPAGNSEDCLYLNVWRPVKAEGGPLPVLVWIYGGGLVRGGASIYPGDFLARHGVVVVTFNYRVGRLGFFAHPALASESPDAVRGNYGYMDQIAALEWVQRNIADFGGDPHRVTIAGESAGGGSVLVMKRRWPAVCFSGPSCSRPEFRRLARPSRPCGHWLRPSRSPRNTPARSVSRAMTKRHRRGPGVAGGQLRRRHGALRRGHLRRARSARYFACDYRRPAGCRAAGSG